MKKLSVILSIFSLFLLIPKNLYSQSIGQTKRMSVNFVRLDYESQIGGFIFTNLSNSSELNLTYNQTVNLPGFYEGISLESIVDYTNQNSVISKSIKKQAKY